MSTIDYYHSGQGQLHNDVYNLDLLQCNLMRVLNKYLLQHLYQYIRSLPNKFAGNINLCCFGINLCLFLSEFPVNLIKPFIHDRFSQYLDFRTNILHLSLSGLSMSTKCKLAFLSCLLQLVQSTSEDNIDLRIYITARTVRTTYVLVRRLR